MAADLGAEFVVTGAGGKDAYGYEQWFFDWAIESLRQVLPIADRRGVKLAIESGSPPGCLVHNIETAEKLLGYESLDSLCSLYDCAHSHIRGEDSVEAFDTLSKRVVHMHAKGDPKNIIFCRWAREKLTLMRCLAPWRTPGSMVTLRWNTKHSYGTDRRTTRAYWPGKRHSSIAL